MTGASGNLVDLDCGRSLHPGLIEVDLGAVEANFCHLCRRYGDRLPVIPMLKADAYGLGAKQIALRLERAGARVLGVGTLQDAARIRRAGAGVEIQLLSGFQLSDLDEIRRLNLIPSVGDSEALRLLAASIGGGAMPVLVKVDCGFGRYGAPLDQAAALVRSVQADSRLRLHGIFTHIPFGDELGMQWAAEQLQAFRAFLAELAAEGIRPPYVQALASPGVIKGIAVEETAIAVGHLIYGLNPMAEESPLGAFRPALRAVRSRLVRAGPPPPDWHAAPYLRQARGPLGVIPIGVYHGYRPANENAFVIIAGRRARVLRPCLENTILDLAEIPEPSVGSEVVLLGDDGELCIDLPTLAGWHGTSILSVLAFLGRSLARVYVG